MIKLFFVLLFATKIFAIEIIVNSGVEDKKRYSVLHIISTEKFNCTTLKDRFGESVEIICLFPKIPANRFQKSENIFFSIISESAQNGFLIRIVAKKRATLFPNIYDLKSNPEIKEEESRYSNRWMVVGYEDTIPYFDNIKSEGLNFPISIESDYPKIGAIDIAKRPLELQEGRDVPLYLRIKGYMEEKKYEEALFEIDNVLREHSDTLFKRELLLFRLRALSILQSRDSYDEIIDLAKNWVKNYPSDDHTAEVLLMLANTYSSMGFAREAKYYFDRIFEEHIGEKYEKLAKVYHGDQFESRGNTQRAIDRYLEALSETQDVEIASIAASRLTDIYLATNEPKEAAFYFEKILGANLDYIFEDRERSYEIMKSFQNAQIYDTALKISKALFDTTLKHEATYAQLLRDTAILHDENGNFKEALDLYEQYLAEYSLSRDRDEIQRRLDSMKFANKESNITKRVEHLDYLREEYRGDNIAKEAFEEKLNILYEEKRYVNLLDEAKDSEFNLTNKSANLVESSAINLIENSLLANNCKDALNIALEYNIKSVDSKEKLFECAYAFAFYDEALEIAEIEYEESEDRIFWLYNLLKAQSALKSCDRVLELIDDIALLEGDRVDKTIYFDGFFCSKELGDEDGMIDFAKKIEQIDRRDLKMAQVFRDVMQIGKKRGDDLMVVNFGSRVKEISEEFNSTIHTPYVEFALYESYNALKDFENAIVALDSIGELESDESRARVGYFRGSAYLKLEQKNSAIESFENCSLVDGDSAWKKLCEDNLKLLK